MKYKISDLAKLLGVTTNTIRRYEKEGYLTPERDSSEYRWYQEYDISRIAIIRLYLKCGFSHSEIKEMLDSNSDNILDICDNRLYEIDAQIERLTYLRHWLKDNIQLMKTFEELKSNFIIRNCLGLKYVIYSEGGRLLDEKERIETIHQFMYSAPEVQLIRIFHLADLYNEKVIPYKGWTIKIKDIEKFKLENILNDENRFIETYPVRKCLFGIIENSTKNMDDYDTIKKTRIDFFKKATAYMEENNLVAVGDVMEVIVNSIGNTSGALACIPIEEKTNT